METDILFDKRIPPAAVVTFMRLRALAWGRIETPPFSPAEFEALTGIGRSTLYGHLKLLRTCDDLRWRTLSDATMVVSFTAAALPDHAHAPSEEPVQTSGQSRNLDSPLLDPNDQLANKKRPVQKSGQSRNLDARNCLFEALADVSGRTPPGRDWSKLPNVTRGILNKAAAQLLKVQATPDQVRAFWPWWQKNDFRGKKHQRPDPWDVVKLWTVYLGSLHDQPTTQPAITSRISAIQQRARTSSTAAPVSAGTPVSALPPAVDGPDD